jgi:hypothetical protein
VHVSGLEVLRNAGNDYPVMRLHIPEERNSHIYMFTDSPA